MPREVFEQKLQDLEDSMLAMASMVEEAIISSVDALRRRDLEASRKVIAQDRLINERRFEIEAECLITIATHASEHDVKHSGHQDRYEEHECKRKVAAK